MAMASSSGESSQQRQRGEYGVEDALEHQPDLGHRAAMQRNGRKLADVFDGAVPGQAVVEIGNDAQIHPVNARLLQHILDDAALAGGGEENLIDELLAGVLEERIQVADDVAGGHSLVRIAAGKLDEPLEGVTKMADALQMMTQQLAPQARCRQ